MQEDCLNEKIAEITGQVEESSADLKIFEMTIDKSRGLIPEDEYRDQKRKIDFRFNNLVVLTEVLSKGGVITVN